MAKKLQIAALVCILVTAGGVVAQPGPRPWIGAPAPAVSAQGRTAPVSYVQVPLELDIQPWLASADDLLPKQAGHWPQWRDWHGIETRYRAWRGPLRLAMRGESLQATAHVRYQLQARKHLIAGLTPSLGCGVKEAPRQALIGVVARLDWTPDWRLVPRFRVLPTRFLDRCDVTVVSIDVSPLVGEVFEDRLESSLREAMAGLRPRLDRLRLDAARAWAGMQTPRELVPGLWLHIQPLGLALAPPQGEGSRVHSALLLTFRARLTNRPRRDVAPIPLPPLAPFRPARPGLRLGLSLDLDYGDLSSALSEAVAGRPLDLDGHRATLDSVSVAPRDGELVVTAELGGDLGGRLEIVARPGLDVESQRIVLHDLSFVFDADDMDLEVLARIFYDRIRDRIAEAADAVLAERMGQLEAAVSEGLAAALAPWLRPRLSDLRIEALDIGVGPAGLGLRGSARGALTLDSAPP